MARSSTYLYSSTVQLEYGCLSKLTRKYFFISVLALQFLFLAVLILEFEKAYSVLDSIIIGDRCTVV